MLNVDSYTIAAEWFPRLLGLIYFFTFGSLYLQIMGLIGSKGILPAKSYLESLYSRFNRKAYLLVPTLFWFNSSDDALKGATLAGCVVSLCLFAGWPPAIMLFILYFLYLSIVSAGQEFLSFGWETFILEITVNAFLMSLTVVPNIIVWISLNFLLFRFHIQAGAVKLQSHDLNWRNFTAIAIHYTTQPLPNTVAWYMTKLPMWFHKICCVMMFFCELVLPFGIFFGETIRLITFVGLFGLQFFIWGTGNLSFLNHLTAAFCVILLNNSVLEAIGLTAPAITQSSLWIDIPLTIAASILLALQVLRLCYHFIYLPIFEKIFKPLDPFHIINRYGLFAVMTTKRYEIVVEGSMDGVEWKEYLFKYKPTEVDYRPRRISPYQPRLDWQAWFLPFSQFGKDRWFTSFLGHLLQGTPEVLKLLKHNPFPEKPPIFVRSLAYEYVFSTPEEKKQHGWWWKRNFVGIYSPSISLKMR